jgi:hypothetical protein
MRVEIDYDSSASRRMTADETGYPPAAAARSARGEVAVARRLRRLPSTKSTDAGRRSQADTDPRVVGARIKMDYVLNAARSA